MEVELIRTTIRVPKEVRDWYADEGKAIGINMSQHMAMILTQHYRNQQALEATRKLSKMEQYDPSDIMKMLDFMTKEAEKA